jgi:hypothetical protein
MSTYYTMTLEVNRFLRAHHQRVCMNIVSTKSMFEQEYSFLYCIGVIVSLDRKIMPVFPFY